MYNSYNYNIIGIDTSQNSTAVMINGNMFVYCNKKTALTTNNEYTKWFDYIKNDVNIRVFDDVDNKLDYSTSEIAKLNRCNLIVKSIIYDITTNIDHSKKTHVCIEGYSYSSEVGRLIDLVTIQTLLRQELVNNNINILVLSPSTLKLESCKMSYEPILKSKPGAKKLVYAYKNNQGISGGFFKKPDMYKSIYENTKWNDDYKRKVADRYYTDILSMSTIPKPFDDMNDAYLLYRYMCNTISLLNC